MRHVFVRQDGIKDCGISCLLMIIRTYKGGCSKEYLRKLTNTTKDGTTAYDLVKAGEKFNFTSFGLKGGIKDVKKEYFPIIAHTLKNNKYEHFVVVYKVQPNKNLIIIADPASSGIKKMKIEEFESISTDQYLIYIPNGPIMKIDKNNRFYKLITNFFISNHTKLIIISGFSFLFIALTIISMFYLQLLMNKVLPSNWYQNIFTLPVIFLIINAIKAICHFFRINILAKLIQKLDFHLNKNIYHHLFLLPDSYYENRTTGEVVARITDLDNIKIMFSNILLDGIISILLSIISFYILYNINNILALSLILLIIIEISICAIFKNKIRTTIFYLKEESIKLYSYLTDTIKEIISIKHLGCNNFLENIYQKKYNKYLNLYASYQKYWNLEKTLIDLLVGTFNILIISLGYYYVSIKKLDISLLLTFLFLYPYFLAPFNQFFSIFINIEDTKEALSRINEFYQVQEQITKTSNQDNYSLNKLTLKNINYQYKREEVILKNINLEINKGEKLLICGKSGSGKTTLIKIIAGYLTEYKGNILINKEEDPTVVDFLRKRVTYIRQGDTLLNMSLKDNIILGRDISEEKFLEVCNLLKIDEFASIHPLQYDLLVDENGENLSAGERQRVLLARSLLKEGDIYILDESLSNLDIKLERSILENIFEYLKDKTIKVVSHRFYIEDLFTRKIELK